MTETWITNTNDKNWRQWCGIEDAYKGRPKATDKYSVEELEVMGLFGIWTKGN